MESPIGSDDDFNEIFIMPQPSGNNVRKVKNRRNIRSKDEAVFNLDFEELLDSGTDSDDSAIASIKSVSVVSNLYLNNDVRNGSEKKDSEVYAPVVEDISEDEVLV